MTKYTPADVFLSDCRTCGQPIEVLTFHDECGECRVRSAEQTCGERLGELGIPRSEWHRHVNIGPVQLFEKGVEPVPYCLSILGLVDSARAPLPGDEPGMYLHKIRPTSQAQQMATGVATPKRAYPWPCLEVVRKNAVIHIQLWEQSIALFQEPRPVKRPFVWGTWHPELGEREWVIGLESADRETIDQLIRGAHLYWRPLPGQADLRPRSGRKALTIEDDRALFAEVMEAYLAALGNDVDYHTGRRKYPTQHDVLARLPIGHTKLTDMLGQCSLAEEGGEQITWTRFRAAALQYKKTGRMPTIYDIPKKRNKTA